MARQEFSTAIKIARFEHCGGRCEAMIDGKRCNALLVPGRYHVDHDNPDGLTGKPTFENARCICLLCHADKTKKDVRDIAKAKRRQADHLGVPVEKTALAGRSKDVIRATKQANAKPPASGRSEIARRYGTV